MSVWEKMASLTYLIGSLSHKEIRTFVTQSMVLVVIINTAQIKYINLH